LQDILITANDNLNGFTQTIRSVFSESATQICLVHQIRNSCRYVVWKDKKEFSRDMKDIYAASPGRLPLPHWKISNRNGKTNMLSKVGGKIGMNSQYFLTSLWRSGRSSYPTDEPILCSWAFLAGRLTVRIPELDPVIWQQLIKLFMLT
jgi:hypothetical protein